MKRFLIQLSLSIALGHAASSLANNPEGDRAFAEASLNAKSGSKVSGRVSFAHLDKNLELQLEVAALPKGKYGMHIHEKGNCDGEDASGAGSHYNPTKHKHGSPGASERHAGDLGNLVIASDSGKVVMTIPTPKDSEFKGWDDLIGRTIVIHEKEDDMKSDPAGNSGKRIACGVIRAVAKAAK